MRLWMLIVCQEISGAERALGEEGADLHTVWGAASRHSSISFPKHDNTSQQRP